MSYYMEFPLEEFKNLELLREAAEACGWAWDAELRSVSAWQRPLSVDAGLRITCGAVKYSTLIGVRKSAETGAYCLVMTDEQESLLKREGALVKLRTAYSEAVVRAVSKRLHGRVTESVSGGVRKLVVAVAGR